MNVSMMLWLLERRVNDVLDILGAGTVGTGVDNTFYSFPSQVFPP